MNTHGLFRPSEYFKPDTVKEAIKLRERYGETGCYIAGGTDLLVEKNPAIKALIDITGLGLDYIEADEQGIRIGAATDFAKIAASPLLRNSPYNVLAEAARQIGTPQIRSVATIGGNICNAVPSADSAPALLVLGATLTVSDCTGGKIDLSIDDFFKGVRKCALSASDLLIEIRLPVLQPHTGTFFAKKGRVAIADIAVASAAVRITVVDNIIEDARIALGAVAPVPMRAKEAESMLRGRKLQDVVLRQVATQASEEMKPISDVRGSTVLRKALSDMLVWQALEEVLTRLG